MQQARKDEILAKKARLAELKRQRELRQKEFSQNRASIGDATDIAAPAPARADSRRDLDNLISSLVDRPGSSSLREGGDGSPRGARGSRPSSILSASQLSGDVGDVLTPSSRPISQSISVATQTLTAGPATTVFEYSPSANGSLNKAEIQTYSKGVQTTEIWTDTKDLEGDLEADGEDEGGVSRHKSRRERQRDEEIREKLRKEIEEELKATQDLTGDGPVTNGSQARYPLRHLSDDELNAVTSSNEFLDFVERSSKVIERALDEEYDVLADYALGVEAEDGDDDEYGAGRGKKSRTIREVCQFWDEKWTKRRMITDIQFSPKHPELLLASYTKNPSAPHEPEGLVQIWSQHLHSRPEYTFHSTSDILTAKFSPFHPNYIIGGSYSGQVLLWDTRSSRAGGGAPVQKTPLTGAGHTHPVYSISIVGTQNAHNILTASTDGVVCSWTVEMLSQPQEHLDLVMPAPSKTEDLAPTTISFPQSDPTFFLVGTEEGGIYPCHRYDRAGAKAGIDSRLAYRGHTAPVMSTAFHPARGPVDLGDLMLSSSLDWSVKLWRVRPPAATSTSATSSTGAGRGSISGATGGLPGSSSGSSMSAAPTSTTLPSNSTASTSSNTSSQVITPLLDLAREDVVYDAKWAPHRPGVFALVDGGGSVEVWDLYADTEVPVARAMPGRNTVNAAAGGALYGRSLNKVAWEEREGRKLAVGGLDGVVTVFEVGKGLGGSEVVQDEWAGVKKLIGRLEQTQANGQRAQGMGDVDGFGRSLGGFY